MAPTQEQLEAFAPMEWATSYLKSPDWDVRERTRGPEPMTDIFNRDTMRAKNCVEHWLELYHKPATPDAPVTRTISLVKFGTGLVGFPGICHGGATLTLMDEALGYVMVANMLREGLWDISSIEKTIYQEAMAGGKSFEEAFKGNFLTAKLEVKFMRPVLCPGIVGIETEMLERKERRMTMRATMKDGKGNALIQVDGVWVKIGGRAKL